MARWKRVKTATFDDLPVDLQRFKAGESDELTQRRWDWLEQHGVAVVDYFTWQRARFRPQRVPARRTRPLSAAELEEHNQKGSQWLRLGANN